MVKTIIVLFAIVAQLAYVKAWELGSKSKNGMLAQKYRMAPANQSIIEDEWTPIRWVKSNDAGYSFLRVSVDQWIQFENNQVEDRFRQSSIDDTDEGPIVILIRTSDNKLVKLTPKHQLARHDWSQIITNGGWKKVQTSFEPMKWMSSKSSGDYFNKLTTNEWIEFRKDEFFSYYIEISSENGADGKTVVLDNQLGSRIKLTPTQVLGDEEFSLVLQNGRWEIENNDAKRHFYGKQKKPTGKDCPPKKGKKQRTLVDIPLTTQARMLCPDTCKKERLTWFGSYGAVSNDDLSVCHCENPNKRESIESRQMSSLKEKECEKFFCQSMLQEHNRLRPKHKVGTLVIDNSLSSESSEWAKHIAGIRQLQHSIPQGKYGENLAMRSLSPPPRLTEKFCIDLGKIMTSMWYDEKKDWDFRNARPKGTGVTGHFTQLVWKGSRKFGCGLAVDRTGGGFWSVARYTPAGNFQGQFKNNVFSD